MSWTTKSFRYFDVEYAKKGGDVVYHFWPRRPDSDFPLEFARDLERGFREVCPADADVRAEFTSRAEANLTHVIRAADAGSVEAVRAWQPEPSYWVAVKGLAETPFADTYLLDRVFSAIENAIKERYPHDPQQDGGVAPGPGGSPARPGGRKRFGRRR